MNYDRSDYGMAEGAPANGVRPSVIEIVVRGGNIKRKGKAVLQNANVADMAKTKNGRSIVNMLSNSPVSQLGTILSA